MLLCCCCCYYYYYYYYYYYFCRIDITRKGSEKFKHLKIENEFQGDNSTHSYMEFLRSHANLMLKQEKEDCQYQNSSKDTTEIPMISTDGRYYSANVRHSGCMT